MVPFTSTVSLSETRSDEDVKATFSAPKTSDVDMWLLADAGRFMGEERSQKQFWHVRRARAEDTANMTIVQHAVDLGARKVKDVESWGAFKIGSLMIPLMKNTRPLAAGDELILAR